VARTAHRDQSTLPPAWSSPVRHPLTQKSGCHRGDDQTESAACAQKVDEMDGLQLSSRNQAWIAPHYALTVGIPRGRNRPVRAWGANSVGTGAADTGPPSSRCEARRERLRSRAHHESLPLSSRRSRRCDCLGCWQSCARRIAGCGDRLANSTTRDSNCRDYSCSTDRACVEHGGANPRQLVHPSPRILPPPPQLLGETYELAPDAWTLGLGSQ
jgi:hypothetical protein